ncbi:XRE family transcriptional regulator [Pseudomonas amygdali]|uniref:XRE family transcriptional regulator n=1 Tax=Pseudomonas syringae group TaxID=136849 RepID=UPI00385735B1|nr:XRE family transcriptional regulator [Pseudomonas amygdali]
MIDKIRSLLTSNDWKQPEAARFGEQARLRIGDLLRGNLERFSLDILVNIEAALEVHSQSQNGSSNGTHRRRCPATGR